MRWLLAGAMGALSGVVYLLVFLSQANVEPLAVFAGVGILAALLDALVSKYWPPRSDGPERPALAGPFRLLLRSAGIFAIAFSSLQGRQQA